MQTQGSGLHDIRGSPEVPVESHRLTADPKRGLRRLLLWDGLGLPARCGTGQLRVSPVNCGYHWAAMLSSRVAPKLLILIINTLSGPAPSLSFRHLLPQLGSPKTTHLSTCTSLHSADSVSTLLAPNPCPHRAPCQAHPPTAHTPLQILPR